MTDRPVADREPLSDDLREIVSGALAAAFSFTDPAAVTGLTVATVQQIVAYYESEVGQMFDAARSHPDETGLLDGIRDEVREAVIEGDANDCTSPDCIADAVYEIVRVRLRDLVPQPAVPVARTHEETCQRCGGLNLWSWTSDLWARVMRGPLEDRWSVLCPRCFADLAESEGAVPPMTVWQIEPQPAVPVAGAEDDWAAHGLAALDHLDTLYYSGDPVTVINYRAATDAIRTALRAAQPEDDG